MHLAAGRRGFGIGIMGEEDLGVMESCVVAMVVHTTIINQKQLILGKT